MAIKLLSYSHKVTIFEPSPFPLTFHTITVPHVDPLPHGTETGSDVPFPLHTHLTTALELTRPEFESIITLLRPHLILFDAAYWVPAVASRLGIKTVAYNVVSAATLSINMVPARKLPKDRLVTEEDVASPPPGYPSSTILLEPKKLLYVSFPFGEGLRFYDRITGALSSADVIAIRTTKELEGQFCEYLSNQYNKPVILSGPVLPEPDSNVELEARWATWLGKFGVGSVVYCAFGSQFVLNLTQFQELLLGFEMTNKPFFVAVKPPEGCTAVEEAFPDGFLERVGEQGVVTGEWVQQPLILNHPSVGCFVNHCGFGTMWESLLCDKQLVLIPQLGDQVMNTKMLAREMKVAVEVERGKDGWVSKENLCEAIKSVMNDSGKDDDDGIGSSVKKNHEIWRQKLGNPLYMSDYLHNFIQDLYALVGI